jgi:hypothetical protein
MREDLKMALRERRQFHIMLEIAVARWVERLEQRYEGAENARACGEIRTAKACGSTSMSRRC